MIEASAADAAYSLSDPLDAVERRGQSFTTTRHGRAVARLVPVPCDGAAARRLLRRGRPDRSWSDDLRDVRTLVAIDDKR